MFRRGQPMSDDIASISVGKRHPEDVWPSIEISFLVIIESTKPIVSLQKWLACKETFDKLGPEVLSKTIQHDLDPEIQLLQPVKEHPVLVTIL